MPSGCRAGEIEALPPATWQLSLAHDTGGTSRAWRPMIVLACAMRIRCAERDTSGRAGERVQVRCPRSLRSLCVATLCLPCSCAWCWHPGGGSGPPASHGGVTPAAHRCCAVGFEFVMLVVRGVLVPIWHPGGGSAPPRCQRLFEGCRAVLGSLAHWPRFGCPLLTFPRKARLAAMSGYKRQDSLASRGAAVG